MLSKQVVEDGRLYRPLLGAAGVFGGGHKKTGRGTFLFFLADGPDYFLSALVMRIYYLRDLTGKKARIKEKRMTSADKK